MKRDDCLHLGLKHAPKCFSCCWELSFDDFRLITHPQGWRIDEFSMPQMPQFVCPVCTFSNTFTRLEIPQPFSVSVVRKVVAI